MKLTRVEKKVCWAKAGDVIQPVGDLLHPVGRPLLVVVDKSYVLRPGFGANSGLYGAEHAHYAVDLGTGELRSLPHLSSKMVVAEDVELTYHLPKEVR